MFNRTMIHKTEVTPVTRVIERSVSPDKVTDVYKDVRKEIETSIIRTFTIKSSFLEAVVMEMQHRYDIHGRTLHVRFNLNGKEHICKTDVFSELSETEIYAHVADFFAGEVTALLLRDAEKIFKKV